MIFMIADTMYITKRLITYSMSRRINRYFKADEQKIIFLPLPHGSILKVVASFTIEVANLEIKQLKMIVRPERREACTCILPMIKVGNYTIQHIHV